MIEFNYNCRQLYNCQKNNFPYLIRSEKSAIFDKNPEIFSLPSGERFYYIKNFAPTATGRGSEIIQGYTIKGFRSQSAWVLVTRWLDLRATARVQGRVCRGRRQEAGVWGAGLTTGLTGLTTGLTSLTSGLTGLTGLESVKPVKKSHF